jgi:hypothetical protein
MMNLNVKYRITVITPLGTFYSKWQENQSAVQLSQMEFEKLGNLKFRGENDNVVYIPEGAYQNSVIVVEKSEQ